MKTKFGIIAIAIGILAIACTKENVNPTNPNGGTTQTKDTVWQLESVVYSFNGGYDSLTHITYDEQGRMASAKVVSSAYTTYTIALFWAGDSVLVSIDNQYQSSIRLNSDTTINKISFSANSDGYYTDASYSEQFTWSKKLVYSIDYNGWNSFTFHYTTNMLDSISTDAGWTLGYYTKSSDKSVNPMLSIPSAVWLILGGRSLAQKSGLFQYESFMWLFSPNKINSFEFDSNVSTITYTNKGSVLTRANFDGYNKSQIDFAWTIVK